MKNKLSKIPPLKGTLQEQINQLRNHQNRLVDELQRALDAKDAEIERLRKETTGSGKQ